MPLILDLMAVEPNADLQGACLLQKEQRPCTIFLTGVRTTQNAW